MTCNFHVGQKVVCVQDGFLSQINSGLAIYTVSSVFMDLGVWHITLLEIPTAGECAIRFRPVVTRKTDISIFKAMLKPSKAPHYNEQDTSSLVDLINGGSPA